MFAFGRKKEKGLKTEGSITSAGSTNEKESKEEKERRKKEKKEAKKAAKQGHSSFYGIGASRSSDGLSSGSGSLTADELKRLEDVRRSFRLEHDEYPPDLPPKTRNQKSQYLSGITADYRDSQLTSPTGGDANSETSSTTSSATSSLPRSASSTSGNFMVGQKSVDNRPPLPKTKPPSKSSLKKGILKGSRGNYDVTTSNELDDSGLLLRNTKDNEYINVYRKSVFPESSSGNAADNSFVNGKKNGGNSATTPEREFADREVSYDEVAAVTAHVRIHSNHLSPVSPTKKSEDVTDSVFSMDELNNSGLLTGECTGNGIVSIKGTKGERPLSSSFPLHMPEINKQFKIPNLQEKQDSISNEISIIRTLVLKRISKTDQNIEKSNIKCEDYGFQITNVGSTKAIKLQIEPTEEYFKSLGDLQNIDQNTLLLPGDQLLSMNGIEIKSDPAEANKRKRDRHARPDPKDQVINIIRGSENKDSFSVEVKSLPEFKELRERFLEEIFNLNDDSSTLLPAAPKVRNFAPRSYNFVQQVGQIPSHFCTFIMNGRK